MFSQNFIDCAQYVLAVYLVVGGFFSALVGAASYLAVKSGRPDGQELRDSVEEEGFLTLPLEVFIKWPILMVRTIIDAFKRE